jgi:hypothetical protein
VGFIAGKTEHHALIASTNMFDAGVFHFAAFVFQRMVNTQGNIRALAGNCGKHSAGISIKAFVAAVVADLIHNLADEFIKIDIRAWW